MLSTKDGTQPNLSTGLAFMYESWHRTPRTPNDSIQKISWNVLHHSLFYSQTADSPRYAPACTTTIHDTPTSLTDNTYQLLPSTPG